MTTGTLVYNLKRIGRRSVKAAGLARRDRWRRALRKGVAATIEHDQLPLRRDYRTVIDVGANRGQFALYARERFPKAHIYSIEPLRGPRAQIVSLFDADPSVQVLDFAAGAEPAKATMNVTGHDDSSSLLNPTELQTSRFPGTDTLTTETIDVRPLDSILESLTIESPALLKLDVQGYELEALKGATRLLERVDTVMTECSFIEFYAGQPLFAEIYAFLTQKGFQLSGGTISSQTSGVWEQGDFVFQRQQLLVGQAA